MGLFLKLPPDVFILPSENLKKKNYFLSVRQKNVEIISETIMETASCAICNQLVLHHMVKYSVTYCLDSPCYSA